MNTTTKTEFVLRFDIGNDATLGDANVAEILHSVANYIENTGITDNRDYKVGDANGNTVGRYGRYVTEAE